MAETRMEYNASRFFVERSHINAGEVIIEGDDTRHISTVLRKTAGEKIVACDGAGMDYVCELSVVKVGEVRAKILYSHPSQGEPPATVILYQSLLKSDKFEYVIQKCIEAGISEIIPVISGRVQYADRMKGDSGAKRLARWRNIARAAAKQSGRGIIPEVHACISFSDAVAGCADRLHESPAGRLALIPFENEEKTTLKSQLAAFKHRIDGQTVHKEIFIFIGPEGGYSPDEIRTCRQNGIQPVTLGPRIFKAETAALATLCQIMYEFEQ